MTAAERLVDRVLLHAKFVAGQQAPERVPVHPQMAQHNRPMVAGERAVDQLISRVLAHAATFTPGRNGENATVPRFSEPVHEPWRSAAEAEPGNGQSSASLLSSPFLSSLDISGVMAGADGGPVSPIPFRPELNHTQEIMTDQRGSGKDMESDPACGLGFEQLPEPRRDDNDTSALSFLQSDESKEQEETRLPEEVKPPTSGHKEGLGSLGSVGDGDRQLQELQVTLTDLKKQLAEETEEKESLHGRLAEALAALAESERATESAQQQLREAASAADVEIVQEDLTTLQVSQSEPSGEGLPSESHDTLRTLQAEQSRLHHGVEVNLERPKDNDLEVAQNQSEATPAQALNQLEPPRTDWQQLQFLESQLEETQRQLEACLAHAAAEDERPEMVGQPSYFSLDEASPNPLDDKLMACLDLRYCLGDLLDPPELLLKAAMGQLYAVLCLQTKAKSFLASQHLEELRCQRGRPTRRAQVPKRPASAFQASTSRPAQRLPQALPHALPVSEFRELDDEASTERRRWSDGPAVPPLALGQLTQDEPRRRPSTASTVCSKGIGNGEVVVARGSAISAVRSAKPKNQCRPSSSPGFFTQKRNNPPEVVKPLRRAMSAGAGNSRSRATSACRSRPQSHSRKGRSCGNPEGFVPQAELWLIKNRAVASMMWPPLSEAARGRRPKTKMACVRCLPDPSSQPQGV